MKGISRLIFVIVFAVVLTACSQDSEKYTITFNVDGGDAIEEVSVDAGSEYTLPTSEKDGFVFKGWIGEDDKLITGKVKVESDLSFKASWEKKEVIENKESEKETIKNPESETVVESDNKVDPTKEYYCETGYKLEGTKCTKEVKVKPISTVICSEGMDNSGQYRNMNNACVDYYDTKKPTCNSYKGFSGVFEDKNGGACYYNPLENVQDEEECLQYHLDGHYFYYGCYEEKITENHACPVGYQEVVYGSKIRNVKCVKEVEPVVNSCKEGRLVEHPVDGAFCLVERSVDAKGK